jgi:DNA-binding transcriptional MocR family regulator
VWPVSGGLHAYITVTGVERRRLLAEVAAASVGVVDGADCHIRPHEEAPIILWFARVAANEIEPGVRALAAAIIRARA